MRVVEFLNEMLDLANDRLDIGVLWAVTILIALYPLYSFFTGLNKAVKEGKGRELVFQTLISYLLALIALVVWFLPEIVWVILFLVFGPALSPFDKWEKLAWLISYWRLAVALGFFSFWVRLLGREFGNERWRASLRGLWIIVWLGAILARWMGIIFISLPLIWAYFALLGDLARSIMPYSNPEDRAERRKRTHAFISYTWGIQSPMVLVNEHAWAKHETRIPGDITWAFTDFPLPFIGRLLERPGLVWTPAHQVSAITGGTTFKRVDGPGVAFTGKLERLDQVFDLRLQLRTREIEAVSRDGVHFRARYFTAFRLDNQAWDRDLYHAMLHKNILLRNADKPGHTEGSFPFSKERIQATLSVTGTRAVSGDPLIYWDQWVMNVVEDQTRKVISQKKLDEMWRPANDSKFANAMDVLAAEIKKETEAVLHSAGILVFVARVVNFQFPVKKAKKEDDKEEKKEGDKEEKKEGDKEEKKMDDISKQLLDAWLSENERQRIEKLSKAQAEADFAEQEARVYAESLLLNTIVESLQRAHEMDKDLPPHVIAMRFLTALQNYAHKQPLGETDKETDSEMVKKKMSELSKAFKTWQENFFPEE